MDSAQEQPMVLSDAMICLEDGDRLLFCHSAALAPVLIQNGKDAVKRFLFDAEGLTRQEVSVRFPHDVALFDLLTAHDILVPVVDAEKAGRKLARSFEDNAKDRQNMALYLLMTQDCNLSCAYCLNGKETYRKNTKKMNVDISCQTIHRALEQVGENGGVEVVFFGGEPLLNWQGIKNTVKQVEEEIRPFLGNKTMSYHLTSNFTILPPDLIEWAKNYNVSLLCDIDGPSTIHDRCRPFQNGSASYGSITSHLQKLIAAELPVVLRATITALNVNEMQEIALLHKELGGAGSLLVPVNPVNSDGEYLPAELLPDVDQLLAGMKAVAQTGVWQAEETFPFNVCGPRLHPGGGRVFGCAAPYGNIWVVDVTGDVYPCTHVVGIARYFLGNVREPNFPRVEPLQRMAQVLDVDVVQGCRECGWRYLCGGGCAITREMVLMNDSTPTAVRDFCQQIHCRFETQAMEKLLWDTAESVSNKAK